MTDHQDVRRIAEWCGWTPEEGDFGKTVWVPPDKPGYALRQAPNYESFDSCREFEQVADERGLLHRYLNKLAHQCQFQAWELLQFPIIQGVHRKDDPRLATPKQDSKSMLVQVWMTEPAQRCAAILKVIAKATA